MRCRSLWSARICSTKSNVMIVAGHSVSTSAGVSTPFTSTSINTVGPSRSPTPPLAADTTLSLPDVFSTAVAISASRSCRRRSSTWSYGEVPPVCMVVTVPSFRLLVSLHRLEVWTLSHQVPFQSAVETLPGVTTAPRLGLFLQVVLSPALLGAHRGSGPTHTSIVH